MVYQSKAYNFVLRSVVACVLAPLVLFITELGGYGFTAMVLMAAIIMGGEWSQITFHKNNPWKIMGIPYILLPCISLLWLIKQPLISVYDNNFTGVQLVIAIFVLVWLNDIGGYVFGKIIGGPKLAHNISPNKTIAGFIGGVIFAYLASLVLNYSYIFAIIVAILASIGDLIESWVKRKCKIKDSGSIIPGHGGMLDRVDGILLVSVVIAAYALWV